MDKSQKILFDALGIVSLVGFAYAGYQIYKLVSDKKSERKSSFIGGNKKTIRFVLTNNTGQTQTEYLFDSRSGQNNPNVSISPNMDIFNRELSNSPKKVSKIEFRNIGSGFSGIDAATPEEGSGDIEVSEGGSLGSSPADTVPSSPVTPPIVDPPAPPVAPTDGAAPAPVSSGLNQAEAPFKMNCKDAAGSAAQTQYIPMISATQFQKGITSVNMGGVILDGECFMEYTMYPNSKIAIVVYYEDYKLSDLLKKKDEANGTSSIGNNDETKKTSNKVTKEINPKAGALAVAGWGLLAFGAYKVLQK